MIAQLNRILARQRTAELQHAGVQARLAREVRMRGRKLRHRNLITSLRARPARVLGALIMPVMLAVLALSAPAAMADPLPGRLIRGRCAVPTRSDRRHRPCTRLVMLCGATVIDGGAGADAFTFTGKIDGRTLVPGSYSLLATPTTDGIAGQQQQTTFEITR
jgi:hypothetical protein